ncbi:MAG: capsule biosynthesis protein [Alsobacter sp.]
MNDLLRPRTHEFEAPAAAMLPARPGRWTALLARWGSRTGPEVAAPVAVREPPPAWSSRGWGWPPFWLVSLALGVIAPSLVAQTYLAFIASDQFVAETRLAVRQADQAGMASEGSGQAAAAASGGAGLVAINSAGQDAHVVTSYLRSRAVVDDLSRELDLRAIFRRPEADWWARLPADAGIDALVRYWNNMVFTYVDGPSGIVTLQVRAFRPQDSLLVAQAALRQAESLVNAMADRARADALASSRAELRRAEDEWRDALAELRAFRDREGLIDPVRAAGDVAKLIQGLMLDKIRLENELAAAAGGLAPDAPGLGQMRARLAGLDRQLAELRAQLAGESTQARNAAAALSRFQVIEVRRQFAEKLLGFAQDGLERARTAAERRRVYLTVFVPPALAEQASYPRRLAYSLLIPAVLLVLWSIAGLIVLSVEDHRL